MEIKNNPKNALKQALEQKQTGKLSSNFSFRMMEHIHQEAEKQKKRRERLDIIALVTAVLALVGLGIYYIVYCLKLTDIMWGVFSRDSSSFSFYFYVSFIVLVLLGLDYWLRKKHI